MVLKMQIDTVELWHMDLLYIEGPDSQLPIEATKVNKLHNTNDHIVGAMYLVVENSLSQGIENLMTT